VCLAVFAGLALTAGCGTAPEEQQPPSDSAAEAQKPAPTTSVPAAGSATISGTIRYDGDVPALRPLDMDADPQCAEKHDQAVPSEILVVGEGGTLANVFVTVTSGLPQGDWPAPAEPVVMNQYGCRYDPHVMGIMVGQPFKILNSDGVLHNVHALPKKNKAFNMAMPASRTEAVETFNQVEEMFKIKCDVHPWMNAYVAVTSHPFFSVTADDGVFSIEGLPAGEYEIEAWHERLGTQTAALTVADGAAESVDLVFTR
jgi:plastocyanin